MLLALVLLVLLALLMALLVLLLALAVPALATELAAAVELAIDWPLLAAPPAVVAPELALLEVPATPPVALAVALNAALPEADPKPGFVDCGSLHAGTRTKPRASRNLA